MSTNNRETDAPALEVEFDPDIEIRIRNFRNLTVAALGNFAVFIALVWPLWVWIEAIPSSMPLRWAFIVFFYLSTVAKLAWIIKVIAVVTRLPMSDREDKKRSRNRDLEIRTNDLEDWILANFCVMVGISTIGFVAWYWTEVVSLAFWTLYYWACTVGCFCLLFRLLKRTIRLYRNVKGLKHEETGRIVGILVGVNAGRLLIGLYNMFEKLWAHDLFSPFLSLSEFPKFGLLVVGYYSGRGPLFDRLPEEWKAERRSCKTWNDVISFFAIFAGPPDEEDVEENVQNRNDAEDACFPPSWFELQPNPVIFSHLRDEQLQPLNSARGVPNSPSDEHLMDTTEAASNFSLDTAVTLDDKSIPMHNQNPPSAPLNAGPATTSVHLSSFTCPQCPFVAKKKFELNKHVTQTHNHRFKCTHRGCGKTFGLRTNLERHEATHGGKGKGLECPNLSCKAPEKRFTREDNLKRHMKGCGTS